MRQFLLATAVVISACGDQSSDKNLNYYFTYDPRSLDPALSTDVPTGEVVSQLFDNLTQFDADAQLKPGLARSWETDAAGRVYTFHLRQNASFHDGRPIKAADVRASLLRALAPGSTGGRSWPLYPIQGARAYAAGSAKEVAGIVVRDDSTLVLTLEEPLNVFPKLLAMPVAAIVPIPTPPNFDQGPTGSGPWKFVSWSHDDAIVLARNENYWGGTPKSDTLRIRIIPEPLTQAAEYEAGQLSVVEVPVGETRRWEQTHADELQRRPALRDLYVAINTTRGPLKDVRVRRALNHAVDVRTLLGTVMANRGVLAAGSLPPGIVGYDSTRAPYGYDPAKAKQLLAEAGYPHGFSIKLWRTHRAELARLAQSIQQNLTEVGIRAEIVERDASSARAAVRNGEADLFLTDWWADYPDPENFNFPLFHSRNKGPGGNYAFLSDTAVDSMILRARATTDETEKARLSRQIDDRVFELAPWIFLWFPVDIWASQPDVTGWRIPLVFTGQRWMEAERTR
ncbi:MAG: peptide/nickel transport system substrate-binding protein [Gemmatimonadales bacterium]|nr:peptide/nickel transport system substrate-binding protein [Gemmatimonadales bacterium]